ncbi:hypothetical protein DXG01_009271 [Tephrocybe rancida]|nr:hypothetical protein DXG01_009271 [Tephrocybe rancida]
MSIPDTSTPSSKTCSNTSTSLLSRPRKVIGFASTPHLCIMVTWQRKEAIRLFGANTVKVHNGADAGKADGDNDDDNVLIFTYHGQKFGNRLLYLVTHEFEPTVLTHEELALFQRCSFVNPNDIASATNKMAALSLQVTDRIVVTLGKLITMTGTILEFSGNNKEATICLDSTEITMDVMLSPSLLRKVV